MAKAKAAGSFLGGIFNNPGVVILGALTIALLFFQKDIREAFGSLGESISGGLGDINIQLPEFKFPEFTFPEIKFPDITFPDFNFSLPSLPGLPGGPGPFVGPERMDVPFPDPERDLPPIDIVPDFGLRDDPRRPDPEFIGPKLEEIFPDQPVSISDFINRFTQPQVLEDDLVNVRPDIPLSTAIIPETQEEFQERAAGLAEMFPEIFRSTSLSPEISFGRQLSRESEDFESVLEAEARRSEAIFANLFGNVQNPNF